MIIPAGRQGLSEGEDFMRQIISVLVENKSGVLSRIAALFAARGFNISSLAVGETEDPSISRMTIVVEGDERILEQVVKQLRRLIEVIKVTDLTDKNFIDRELILVKVKVGESTRSKVIELVDIFRAKIVDVGQDALTIEITGIENKLRGFLDLMNNFGIKELARTGKIALNREQ